MAIPELLSPQYLVDSASYCMHAPAQKLAASKMDVYPLPRVDDQLDLLSHSRYFTTLDLATGYWQVSMAPESQEKTAFIAHSGLYEFTIMPFGLCNVPATFQRLMETVLA